jgi:hypothetical protein
MSIALIITAGFGSGTLAGNIAGVVLSGYSIGASAPFFSAKHKMLISSENRTMSVKYENRTMSVKYENRVMGVKIE